MGREYYKLMLGKKSMYASECFQHNYIGADYGFKIDLTNDLEVDWKDFNHKMIPKYLRTYPDKSKIAAGLACGALWTVIKGMKIGDILVCPNGHGVFVFGEIISDYYYAPGDILPHRRSVKWYSKEIPRKDVSPELKSSTSSSGTFAQITQHSQEINQYLNNDLSSSTSVIEAQFCSPVFALEKHLEEFLIQNWKNTELGKNYDIFEEDEEVVGQQYPSDTGPIDILAISKDKTELLVVELKRGRVSDSVVGQIQRYMGYVLSELSEPGQTVKGIIIGLEDDIRIRRALSVTNNIEFFKYKINFELIRG